jgi:RNA recognition motif-containing protein
MLEKSDRIIIQYNAKDGFSISPGPWRTLSEKDEKEPMKIYVGNLSYNATESEIKSAFQAYGEVDSVSIITDRDTGRSKGFGFVEMADKEQALAAIAGLNETELGGRRMMVSEARPKPPRDDRRGGGGGGGHRGGGGGGNRGGYGGGRDRY